MKETNSWRVLPPREPDQKLDELGLSNEYLVDLAAIWADYRFSTPDGRRFACIYGSDSILQRAQTLKLFLSPYERSLLGKHILAGAIVEFGAGQPPMLYGDFDNLKSDWLKLHHSFNAPLTEEESAAFDLS